MGAGLPYDRRADNGVRVFILAAAILLLAAVIAVEIGRGNRDPSPGEGGSATVAGTTVGRAEFSLDCLELPIDRVPSDRPPVPHLAVGSHGTLWAGGDR